MDIGQIDISKKHLILKSKVVSKAMLVVVLWKYELPSAICLLLI